MSRNLTIEDKVASAWSILTERAKARSTIYYHQLQARVLGKPLEFYAGKQTNTSRYLEEIQRLCEEKSWPPITGLVVSSVNEKPRGGFRGDGYMSYDMCKELIYKYDKWEDNPYVFVDGEGEPVYVPTDKKILADLRANPNTSQLYRWVKSRDRRQKIFRDNLLREYGGNCAVCGLNFKGVLEAAHIKALSKCEKGDPAMYATSNGILMCRNHHRLFDLNKLNIEPDYSISWAPVLDGSVATLNTFRKLRLPKNEVANPAKDLLAKKIHGEK